MHHDSSVFFYFSLVRPLSQHAVQFSILIFITLVHLFESLQKDRSVLNKYIDVPAIIIFSGFILLLSSKLIIALYLFYLFYFCLHIFFRKRAGKRPVIIAFAVVCLLAGGIVLLSKNHISERFRDIIYGDMKLIQQEKFNPGIYFNGLQFRLLEWRFVSEILTEEKAWLAGVSAGDKQQHLDQKYISTQMYIGEPSRGDRGFLGYNVHNQFLESLLQSGIIGLLAYLLISASLIRMMWHKKNRELSFVTITVLLYSITESVFETQYGMVIFIFFPLFFYQDISKQKTTTAN